MKKYCFSFLIIFIVFQSCFFPERETTNFSDYKPIYISRADLDSTIQLKPAQEIINSGKIYINGNLLFVGEKRVGFHVFDNSDVQNPKKIKFIQAHGASDLAIRKNILYINQATDLITVEYNFEKEHLKLVKRVKNTFPKLKSPDGFLDKKSPKDSILINWELKK